MTALQIVQKFYPEVTLVKDASKSLDIEVLAKDIKQGANKNHKSCVFAKACKRNQPIEGAVVAVSTAYLIQSGVATRYRIPQSLSREIVAFDRHGEFYPGPYSLLAPKRTLGTPSLTGSKKKSGKKKAPQFRKSTAGIRTNLTSN